MIGDLIGDGDVSARIVVIPAAIGYPWSIMVDPEPAAASASGATSYGLLSRARGHDPDAWKNLVHLYSPLVFHWCRQSGLASHDAADVMQEVFQAVHLALERFEPQQSGAFRGWLWTISRNKLNDFFRKQQHEPAAAGGSSAYGRWQQVEDAEPLPSEASVSGERKHSLLHRALELIRKDFQDTSWNAFCGVVLANRPAAEVAAELSISVGAVYQARARVLKRLRDEMGDLVD